MRKISLSLLLALSLVGCGKSLVADRVQATPGVIKQTPRKPVRKVISPATSARMEILRHEEDADSLTGFKASDKVKERLSADVQCTVTDGNELGIVVKDRNLMLVATLANFQRPRFAQHWRSNDKGTITFSDEVAPLEREEVGPADGAFCSIAAHSDLKRTEGTLRCKGLEGFSKKQNKKIAYSVLLYFNCASSPL